MNKHKSNKIKENSNTVRHLIMGQIITTQNLVAIKVVRHAGQQGHLIQTLIFKSASMQNVFFIFPYIVNYTLIMQKGNTGKQHVSIAKGLRVSQ